MRSESAFDDWKVPLCIGILLAMPAVTSSVSLALVLDGGMRGLISLIAMPLLFAAAAWQSWQRSWEVDPMVKLFAGSWAIGLPLGLVGWGLASFVRWLAA